MSLVLDSSVTLAWVYSVETTEEISGVFDRVVKSGAWVPALWRLEVANVLEMGVRKGRSDTAFRDAALADLALLPISVDPETDRQAWGATAKLAARHRVTLYDAAYLELARRRGLPLATLDNELRVAATLEEVALLGTETFSVPGKRTSGTGEQWMVLVGPGWKGALPEKPCVSTRPRTSSGSLAAPRPTAG